MTASTRRAWADRLFAEVDDRPGAAPGPRGRPVGGDRPTGGHDRRRPGWFDHAAAFEMLGSGGGLLAADLADGAERAHRHLLDGDGVGTTVPVVVDGARRLAHWDGEGTPAAIRASVELGAALGWSGAHRDAMAAAWVAGGPPAVAATGAVAAGHWALDGPVAVAAVEVLRDAGVPARRYRNWLTLTGRNQRLVAEPDTSGSWWWLVEPCGREWVATRRLAFEELGDLGLAVAPVAQSTAGVADVIRSGDG
ncbi:MAG: hypothetical protein ACK5PP_13420 [Acidimicrobiales bacterium]